MKRNLIVLILLVFILTACGNAGEQPEMQHGTSVPSVAPPTAPPTNTPTPTGTPTPTPTNTPTPTPMTVTLLTAGDCLLHETVLKSGIREDGTINYDNFFENFKDEIEQADIAVINQETVLGGTHYPYAGYPQFNSPIEIGDAEVKVGFDVILHANNHITDYGIEGLLHTLDYWDTHPEITVLGIQRTLEEYKEIQVIEKNGIKIAMLNYTYGLNVGTSGKYYMVDSFDYEKAKIDIEKAKELADFVVVFPHWGDEYVYEPPKQERDWTAFFAENGVDLVIGNHAHVIQPIEWIETQNGHRMLVYYSLGNYISSMDYTNTMLSMLAKVTITKDETGTYITDASAEPIVTHYERTDKVYFAIYRLSEYTDELAKRHFIYRSDNDRKNISVAKLDEICRNVLGSWYLTEENE